MPHFLRSFLVGGDVFFHMIALVVAIDAPRKSIDKWDKQGNARKLGPYTLAHTNKH